MPLQCHSQCIWPEMLWAPDGATSVLLSPHVSSPVPSLQLWMGRGRRRQSPWGSPPCSRSPPAVRLCTINNCTHIKADGQLMRCPASLKRLIRHLCQEFKLLSCAWWKRDCSLAETVWWFQTLLHCFPQWSVNVILSSHFPSFAYFQQNRKRRRPMSQYLHKCANWQVHQTELCSLIF